MVRIHLPPAASHCEPDLLSSAPPSFELIAARIGACPRAISPWDRACLIERQQAAGHSVQGRLADPHRAVALPLGPAAFGSAKIVSRSAPRLGTSQTFRIRLPLRRKQFPPPEGGAGLARKNRRASSTLLSAPSHGREPSGSVQPTTTNSSR